MSEHPDAMNDCSASGHWEADAGGARHYVIIVTAAEQRSRFFTAACAPRKTKAAVGDALRRCLAPHQSRCETFTFDNGE